MRNRLHRYQTDEPETAPVEVGPSEAHVKAVAFIDELLGSMMSSNSALSPIVKMMSRVKPAILRDLSQIPADQLQAFLVDMGKRMIDAGTPDVEGCATFTGWDEGIGSEPDHP